MKVVRLKEEGLHRVLDSKVGMTFIVEEFTEGRAGPVAHVRDYRYPGTHWPYQTWSIGFGGYELIEEESES